MKLFGNHNKDYAQSCHSLYESISRTAQARFYADTMQIKRKPDLLAVLVIVVGLGALPPPWHRVCWPRQIAAHNWPAINQTWSKVAKPLAWTANTPQPSQQYNNGLKTLCRRLEYTKTA